MWTLGIHILLDLQNCEYEFLNDAEKIKLLLKTAAGYAGATVLSSDIHQFAPQGVSGVVLIAESHLAIHTWPEFKFAAIDIFTCGNKAIPEKAKDFLIDVLKPELIKVETINRGIKD